MTTPGDICTQALLDAGITGQGQTPSAADTNNAFTRLSWLLSQWNRKRWLIYHLIDVAKVCTGAQSYTIGPAGDFNTPRPDQLEYCFLRQITQSQPNQIDYYLKAMLAREDYAKISLKGLVSFPQVYFYDSGWPSGTLYPWPIPQASIYELHIGVKDQLTAFTGLTQSINLPPEYEAALYYNLLIRLRSAYQLPADEEANGFARDALSVIRNANAQIAQLTLPRRLMSRGSKYNIFGDYSYD